ncbi:copper-binding protein [Sulfuricystis thermophila]|uniref:copper-binding protein n=1 Tax=Sulfuricystis thermophila TaxID=2496847 RepID=UPI001036002C|nr:copper-binding protein [Sulfuricystis thermophila]
MKSLASLLAAASLLVSAHVSAAEELSEGIVKKIDAPTQRIMLAHGPIKNLGMMPMTMMFKVKEPAMLKAVSVGDKVRFRVEDIGGNYTITRLERAK